MSFLRVDLRNRMIGLYRVNEASEVPYAQHVRHPNRAVRTSVRSA